MPHRMTIARVPLHTLLIVAVLLVAIQNACAFNEEVEKRILERLDYYLRDPVSTNQIVDNFRRNGAFSNNMDAGDRDHYLKLAYSLSQPLVYYGLEDGTIAGYVQASGYYREPGNSGYPVENEQMAKHLNSCVDGTTGEVQQCLMAPGSNYISCRDGEGVETGICEQIELCPSQPICESGDAECEDSLKWCRQYDIVAAPSDGNSTGLGYVPLTNFCLNSQGHFSQEEGTIINPLGEVQDDTELTSCTFGDGTLVNRHLAGDYAYCGGQTCDTTFQGGYTSIKYDPRYRPWYIRTKELQKPSWMPPYAFFSLAIGITYTMPIYTEDPDSGREVFAGVLSVDYRFEDIANFLEESYGGTDTLVVVFEDDEPNFLIGVSTGSDSARFVMDSDPSQPCPVDHGEDVPCSPVRTPVFELLGSLEDCLLSEAARRHKEAGYPQQLLSVKAACHGTSDVYSSHSSLYAQENKELNWRVVVVEPGIRSETDYVVKGDGRLIVVSAVAGMGILVCILFLGFIYKNRHERAIIYSDWKFTSAFICGCMLLNFSTYTLLGENTEFLCFLRFWTFDLFFVLAVSPLFVKIWRIRKLVGGSMSCQRKTITNFEAGLCTAPLILIQVTILLIFTIVDPPKPTETIDEEGGTMIQSVTCENNSDAFMITQSVFVVGLLLIGCILAYASRDMEDDFGESKQLLFSMYNIAFVGIVVAIVIHVAGLERNDQVVLLAIAVFWGTCCSAGAFVLPRVLQIQRAREQAVRDGRVDVSRVSGLERGSTARQPRVAVRTHGPADKSMDSLAEELPEEQPPVAQTGRTTRVGMDGSHHMDGSPM